MVATSSHFPRCPYCAWSASFPHNVSSQHGPACTVERAPSRRDCESRRCAAKRVSRLEARCPGSLLDPTPRKTASSVSPWKCPPLPTRRRSHCGLLPGGMPTTNRLVPRPIVLSKSSAENDSFKLYARDIISHPLRAELVTISACYGAGERSYA